MFQLLQVYSTNRFDSQSEKRFHVRGAQSIDAIIPFSQFEGIGFPLIAIERDGIGMSREN